VRCTQAVVQHYSYASENYADYVVDVKTCYAFYFGHVFTFLTFFFNFPNVFYLKNVGKVQSGKQINKNTFKITATKWTYDFSVACRMT